ncbi:MAG: plasmid replication protein RepC [Candidatus Competibacter sp.]|nr:plasmid replication protein RepC [Candidatus Competibacter sp.]
MNNINGLNAGAAPRPGRIAPGYRRETPHSTAWRQRSETYSGLPAGAKHPHDLIDALRHARASLGLSDSELALISDLYAATQPADWQPGCRPMAWPSNDTLASRHGKSISAIQRMTRKLAEKGFLVMRDSPTGKRYGFRNADGRIIKAYGFDLSLLAVRFEEFRALVAERKAADAQIRALRANGYIAKKRLLATIEAADAAGLWTTFWEQTEADTIQLASRLAKSRDVSQLRSIAHALDALLASALDVFQKAAGNPIPEPSPAPTSSSQEPDPLCAHGASATLNNSTDFPLNMRGNKAHQGCNPRPAAAQPEFATPGFVESRATRDPLRHVDPDAILARVPELVTARDPALTGWHALSDALGKLRHRYEISHRLWAEGVDSIGKDMALAIMAIMVMNGRNHYMSPGGCFRRMIERAKSGELDILRSYFGLLRHLPSELAPAPLSTADDQTAASPTNSLANILGAVKERLN